MLTTIIAGAFVLGVVVLVHEFGHFIVAKMGGIYVKTFSVGFGKKLIKRRMGETQYALSVLPFGGYVKFAGESELYDEEPDAGEGAEEPPGDEIPDSEIPRDRYFTTRPKLIRAAVLLAGPFMNYLLAVGLYAGVLYVRGVQELPTTRIGKVTAASPADSVGLRPGDLIQSIDGSAVRIWSDVERPFFTNPDSVRSLRVERDGREIQVSLRPFVRGDTIRVGFAPLITPEVGRVQHGRPAWKAGIRPGDVIRSINDTTVTSYDDVRRIIHANPGKRLAIEWSRGAHVFADSITPETKQVLAPGSTSKFQTVGLIGIEMHYIRHRENLWKSAHDGFATANHMIWQILYYLYQLFTGKMGVRTLGGPILITQMAGDVANWGFDYLLLFLAFFNVNLCIFNLLPVVPFDGGHLAILAVEGVTRRPLNRRLRGWLTQGGFILIILLMVFVVVLDLTRCSGAGPAGF